MRRIIAMLLAIVMLIGNIPFQVFAADTQQQTAADAAENEETCGTDAAIPETMPESAADAEVYVTVSNRGDLGLAYERVIVSDMNRDGRLSVDEALNAAHTACGRGYASEEGSVTKLWGVETTNVSFFVNHRVISSDVCAETVRSGDYLVASVDQDAAGDYDKYSCFDALQKHVGSGEPFTLTLTDDAGNALAGMEIGLWNGSGSTTMTGQTTDVNGSVTLTLNQQGLYCITAKGTVVETAVDIKTMEMTCFDAPIIAPVCVVKVEGIARQSSEPAETAVARTETNAGITTFAETELSVSGGTIILAPGSVVGPATLTKMDIYTQGSFAAASIVSATQNGNTIDVILADTTDPAAALQAGFTASAGAMLSYGANSNKCTLSGGQGQMNIALYVRVANQTAGPVTYTVNLSTPKGTAYTVTAPTGDGFTFSGKESVYEGQDYTFTISVNEGYDASGMVVRVNDETVTGTDGSYTVKAVSQDLEITVEGVVKKALCTVTLTPGEGYTISSDDIPYKGEDYTFTVAADCVQYKTGDMKVMLDGETELTGEDGLYTIPALEQDCTVTVTGIVKKELYTVTKNAVPGVTVTGADTVLETDPYTFSVLVDPAYDASEIKVTVNGEEVALSENGSYTIDSVSGNLTVTVTGVIAKTVYNVTLTEGEGYTISGQATSYAGEPYTFTVTVDDAIYKANEIIVKVNGEAVTLTEGEYTIEALEGDTIVTVENVVERKLFTVTKPEISGVTVTGADSVREGKAYSFSVSVDSGYDSSAMVVMVNDEEVTLDEGSYTIGSVNENLVIAVESVIAKTVCSISLPTGKGFTVSGAATAYAGDSYSFTVRVNPGYNGNNLTVTVNGSEVSGTDGTYTITLEGDTTVEVTGVERVDLPATELTVSDNVIDITDRTVYSLVSSVYAKATNIQISGATVMEAYENGTTVYVILDQTTADAAEIGVTFGTSLARCTMEGTTGSVTLSGGEGSKIMTLTGKFSNSRKGTATYTLIFFRDEPSTTPPVLKQAMDTAEVYQNRTLTLNLENYFADADSYYLVTEAGNSLLDGSTYSITPSEPGTFTLVFAAVNEAGECPDKLTVTVTVKEIVGGIWLNYTTSNGSVNYVTFTDAGGNSIDGIGISCEGKKISVVLPKTYDLPGSVTATFNRTANDSGLPFLSSSSAFNQGTGSRTDVYTNTLSNGAAIRSVYLYNAVPKAASNVYETITISYSIKNELPILAEGVSAAAEATITAGENYTLDLSTLFTDADGDTLTYLVSIDGAAAVAADAAYSYTTDTAGTYTLVFTANDGKGISTASYTVTLTVRNSEEKKSMTIRIPEGLEPIFYVSTGYGEDGIDIRDAAIQAEKGETAEGMTAYTLNYPANASMISFRTEDWGGMAFSAEADSTVILRQVQLSVKDYDGNAAESTNTVTYDGHTAPAGTNGWLLVTGTGYTYTAVPADTVNLATAAKTETLESGADVFTLHLTLGIKDPVTITVTTGAKAQLYNYDTRKYYYATEFEPKIITDNGDGTTTYFFAGSGGCLIYRVSMEGKVTKAGYFGWNQKAVNAVYDADDVSSSYRLDDYSGNGQANSGMAEDSVVLNVNGRNHLAMNVGDSKTLKAYRVWELIKISYQNYIITPDFTFSILSGSDVISLTEKDSPSVGDGDWMTLTALKEGTAVIEVTYGAMEIAGGSYDGIYGATDPARTGLVIVQVGGNEESVSFGIDGFSSRGSSGSKNITYNPNSKRDWDAEFDTLYFTGTSGELKLSPTASGAITQVAVSHNKGASWTALTAKDGVYTAPIVSGNNILRVTTDSGVAYQVVRGDKVAVQITEQSGDGDGKVEPGETVRIALKGLHMPIPKMAGNYNPGFVSNNDGYSPVHLNYTVNGQAVYGPGSQYTFITAANYLDIAIPADIQTDKLTMTDGYIGVGVLGLTQFDVGGDSHRNIPDNGCGTRDSKTTFHTRSILPEITVSLEGVKVPVPVTGVTLDQTALTMDAGDTQTLTAAVTPENADNRNVAWSTDNAAVATAADGIVTAVGAGIATITVTTVDGGKTATCEVTVKQPVESIAVTPENVEVEVGKTAELAAQVLPENASDKTVTWTSSDDTVATVENGVVTGVKAGTAIITATAGEKTGSCTVTVKEISKAVAQVYLSVSHDAEFVTTESSKVMALQKVTVPYFDLTPYGLGEFNLPVAHADYGKPTMLHLYIYATEVFQYGVSPEEAGKGYLKDYIGSPMFAVSGGPGSVCMDKFWGMDMNLNYYHNYAFPADGEGYGTTADRVPLENGDIITIGHFTSWSFFGDSTSIFNYIAAGSDEVVTTAAQNETLQLQVCRAGADLGGGGSKTPVRAVRDIYYVKAEALSSGDVTSWTKLGTTDSTGKLTADISSLHPGQYILAVAGQKGVEYPNDIVSTPGGILLHVTESTLGAAVQNVVNLIKAIGEVTLDSGEAIAAARAAYNALTEEQRALVANYKTLTEAEERLAALKTEEADKAEAQKVTDRIEAIGEVTEESEEAIRAARAAYDALTDTQKAYVTNYEDLLAAEEALRLLKLSNADIANMYQTTGNYLAGLDAPGVGSINGEWRVIGLSRAGREVADSYYEAVVKYVQEQIESDGRLHPAKSSDNSRIILALTAIGKDVTNVGGYNLLSGLNVMKYIGNQGINGYIWALMAFDSHDYPIPEGDVTREKLIHTILQAQLADGGWALAGSVSDPDITGMALQALAPYCNSNAKVKSAVDAALMLLSGVQNSNGTFSGSEGTTCESLAQVITGLTALGINPETDSRFVKNGVSAMDALAAFYGEDGEFKHGPNGERNMMATEQGYYALVSYYRMLEKKTSLYDMSDVKLDSEAAAEVDALIDAIGTVTANSGALISAARTAYNNLTEAQKALVTKLPELEAAEKAYAQMMEDAARNKEIAERVEALIDAIGTVTLSQESENKIKAARDAYNALDDLTQKPLVGNLKKLEEAEAALAALKKNAADQEAANAVIRKIDAIGTNITLGSEAKIQTARNAYNALTADQKKLVTNYQALVNAEIALDLLKSTVSVTFSLLCCYKHGTGETTTHTLSAGNLQTWIAAKNYKVRPGATVKDLFEQALTAAGLTWKNPTGNYVESVTRNGVTIGEFTNGAKSGWMYTLNGKHPGLGVNQQKLVNGDTVVFHYSDDYTKEEGSAAASGTAAGTSATGTTTNYITTTANQLDSESAESVERLIEDIGEEITLESEAKILAARAAYDKLTEEQKKLVKNYDKLVAAEEKLALLKGFSAEDVYMETGNYIQNLGTPGVGTVGGEWMVIGLARSGRSVPDGYYDHVLKYVRENINDRQQLHSAKSSDNSRMILALTAIGKDVSDVDGHDLLKGLNDMDYIRKQGINGPVWALLAFDSGNYPVPEGNVSRKALISVILEAQLSDGGWALSGERSDPDLTAMALQALAPYLESDSDVKKAAETAIRSLSGMQNDNGSFSSVDGANSESIAQVIVALTALEIDADTDARFVKNGISALDALLTYYIPGGGFRHVLDGMLDGMSSEQAFYALVAYDRMHSGKTFLYDMTDVVDMGGDVIVEETTKPTEAHTEPVAEERDNGNAALIWAGVMTLCAAAITVILLNRKKLFGKF